MTRLPFILLAFLLLAAGNSQATSPRVASLGGAGDYLEDDANSRTWCGSLGDYPDAATLDFGHFNIYYGYHDDTGRVISGPSLGMRRNLGGQWGTAAVYLNTAGSDAPAGNLYRDDLEGNFSLMYSRPVGKAQLGLVYRQGSGEKEAGEPGAFEGTSRKSSVREFGVGLRVDLAESAYLDLAGEIRRTGEEFVSGGDPSSHLSADLESTQGLALRARLFLRLGERTALVPLVGYTAENRPVQPQSPGYFPGIDGHLLRLGCGLNFFPDTDHFLFASGQWDHGSTGYSYEGDLGSTVDPWTHDWDSFSLLAGWESRFQPWLTLRSSVGYRLARGDGAPPDLLTTDSGLDYDDLTYTLGAGFHLGSWDLDAALTGQEPFPFFGDWGLTFRGYRTTYLSVALRWQY